VAGLIVVVTLGGWERLEAWIDENRPDSRRDKE
jgi:hypothetical protein